jgi:2-C-methyl-D-erythritol 2,4-cyclodiphosphate synthase
MKISETIDRAFLFEAQTPQMMRRKTLLACYRKLGEKALNATDEASLLESCGHSVAIVPNEDRNLKITTPADLAFAESCAGSYTIPFKIGLGRDTHRLVSGRKFYLGGRVIPFEKGSLGHSDGDALLHALTDAVLGVLGEGDIGDWFSDKDPRFKNIRSTVLIQRVLVHAREKGWTPAYADCIVTLERPKLGPHKKQIGASVARLLGIPPSEVSIKAKTAEGLGAEGAGLAVTCEALVAMRRAS